MKHFLAILIVAVALYGQIAFAESIIIDSTTYDDIRWGRITPATVTLFHKTGVANIPLEKLPAELQQKFGYDSDKAAAFRAAARAEQIRQTEAAESARVAAQIAKQKSYESEKTQWLLVADKLIKRGDFKGDPINGAIRQKRDDGVVIEDTDAWINPARSAASDLDAVGGSFNRGGPRPIGKMPDNKIFVKNWFPRAEFSDWVQTVAVKIGPVNGMTSYDVGRTPTFEEWQKLRP